VVTDNSNRATTSSVLTPNKNTEVATSLNSSLRRRRGVMHGSMPQVEPLVSLAVQFLCTRLITSVCVPPSPKSSFANKQIEDGFDEFGNKIENFPENAANWTGEQVGNIENFGDSVENKFDNAVDDVENFPENAANWTGEQVGKVENFGDDVEQSWDNGVDRVEDFGDRMGNAYDEGRDDARYGDDDDY
jgi:uncharacterized protein YktA (UPF0223 family)